MKNKANDKDVPADEMLLAEAIAAAKAKGLRWTKGVPFRGADGERTSPDKACEVCALGALHAAGSIDLTRGGDYPNGVMSVMFINGLAHLSNVIFGNDCDDDGWVGSDSNDYGESLGWAFRCAMTQEDS